MAVARERFAIYLDAQFRRAAALRIDEAHQQFAVAGVWLALHSEYDREGVRRTARPSIVRAGMHVRPIALWIGMSNDKESVVAK